MNINYYVYTLVSTFLTIILAIKLKMQVYFSAITKLSKAEVNKNYLHPLDPIVEYISL